MSKKSTATRQANAARRPQTASKAPAVALVRTPRAITGVGGSATATAAKPQPKTATNSFVVAAPERPRPVEVARSTRPAPKREPVAAAPQVDRTNAARVARARATQRARAATHITPDHYAYVINDLKVIAALAIAMFVIIIALHFILPA